MITMSLLMLAILPVSLMGCGYAADASQTVFNETKASTLLEKYKLFKNQYASLESKRATIKILSGKIERLEGQYDKVPRSEWNREDVQTVNQWNTEIDGLKSSYNNLAAQYNADMAKANVNFTNVGSLPKGASEPLPREVAPYIEN